MKYEIEYEETVTRYNSVTIEVETEEEGEEIADILCNLWRDWEHPDDIFTELENLEANVIEICKGAERCDYEIC